MATSNVVISEGQVTFKGVQGHKHDGILSTLIDTSKYSIFDFIVAENAKDSDRARNQANRKEMLKTFIISTVEDRVLKPTGIALQANSITAREIVSGTITADQLSSNIILVNNIIRSSNYINNTGTYSGWAIFSNGTANFNNVNIRGNLATGAGVYAAANTPLYADNIGQFSLGNKFIWNTTANSLTINAGNLTLGSNLTWNGSDLTIRGTLQFANGTTPGTFSNGGNLTAGNIGGISITSSYIQSSDYPSNPNGAGFRINSDGSAVFNEVEVRGTIYAGNGFIGGIDIGTDYIQSVNYNAAAFSGFIINSDGSSNFNEVTVSGTITASIITGSSITAGTFTEPDTGLKITADGYIKGSGQGVKIKGWADQTGTILFGNSITTPQIDVDSISVSNGTNEHVINSNNAFYLNDVTFISGTASYAAIRIQRSGTANMSHHMVFAKSDSTYVGGIRYKNGDNNTMVFVGDITGSSDVRLKQNIVPLTDSLSIVNRINPVKFNFIRSPQLLENGFIAQELFEVYPMAVEPGGDSELTEPWSVMSARLIPILTGSIKELSAKVDSLEARIQTLEGV